MDHLVLEAKVQAGRHAASLVHDGMRVGLGTGSTVHFTVEALADGPRDLVCVATSKQTEELAHSHGLRVIDPDHVKTLDIAIDGADEVDPSFNLTKGGGGAHTREKIVAAMAATFIVVVDESKLVDHLGAFGTPLEILDFAPGVVIAAITDLGASDVTLRAGLSDNANLLADAQFGEIHDPLALASALAAVPGVVEHGIFPGAMVDQVVVGTPTGVRLLEPPQ